MIFCMVMTEMTLYMVMVEMTFCLAALVLTNSAVELVMMSIYSLAATVSTILKKLTVLIRFNLAREYHRMMSLLASYRLMEIVSH